MIAICNSLWKVIDVPDNFHKLMRSDGSYSLACCDNYDKTIYISWNLSYQKYKQVLAHELCHAYIFELGISIPTKEEEMICNLVADYGRNLFEIVDLIAEQIKKARA
ncbi:MAG: ImmA/IrrE family metallo-endopeptidase [Clostridia bacterium]|nr:ImmA/IrrE family metallo-endopeptidase [Clostridia bacterium]